MKKKRLIIHFIFSLHNSAQEGADSESEDEDDEDVEDIDRVDELEDNIENNVEDKDGTALQQNQYIPLHLSPVKEEANITRNIRTVRRVKV